MEATGRVPEVGPGRMTPQRWAQVRSVLESALDLEPARREEFLKRTCGADRELVFEVKALLQALEESGSLLKEPILGATAGSSPRQDDSSAGTAIGPWTLLRRIGDGGMASVYAAARSDRQFRKIAALKIIKSGMDSEETLRRFRNERQILAGLDHPNITRLLDGGSTPGGLPYLVMEYVVGTPITQYCDTHNLSVTERLRLFRTVCCALQYAHQNLVIHRDLKPANILVTGEGVPMLLDFGIAKLLRPEYSGETPLLTRTQMRVMTPEYASPEQVRGDPITTASDIYSLGVVLYELITGRRPHQLKAGTATEIERAICESDAERPSTVATRLESVRSAEGTPDKLARRLRGDLDAIVLQALRKEPQRRYQTADRLADDITRHLGGLPVSASGDRWSYRIRKFTSRHKAGVAVAALFSIVLIGASVVSTYFGRQAQQQKQSTLRIASFMVGDFDSALASGTTSARKAALDKILDIINRLSPDVASDPNLRAVLFKAYLKAGDLQGNVYENNLGDAAGARLNYERALALARAPAEIAQASMRLGDAASNTDRKEALANYYKAKQVLERTVQNDPRRPQAWLDLTRAWYKIGLVQSGLGNKQEALGSYQRELELAHQAFNLLPSLENRREQALAEEHIGDMLGQTGNLPEALVHLRRSLAVYQELEKSNPESAVRRRDVAIGYLQVASVLRQEGDRPEAIRFYRNSLQRMDALVSEDPGNEQYQRDRNSVFPRLAELLYLQGQFAESRSMTLRALEALEPLISKPAPLAHDLYQYCSDLLNTHFSDLHRPQQVLVLAQRAVELTRGADPAMLDVLARAQEENGELEAAVATEAKALAVSQPGTKRAAIEANLARFHRRLASSPSRKE
jgi:serine/threonine protein kinase